MTDGDLSMGSNKYLARLPPQQQHEEVLCLARHRTGMQVTAACLIVAGVLWISACDAHSMCCGEWILLTMLDMCETVQLCHRPHMRVNML